MKVIFLEDVPNVAKSSEIKEVAEGYGRHFLIPRKLALLANAQALHAAKAQLEKRARLQAHTEAELLELSNQLNGREIIFEAKTGGKERLYGSITTADIAAELERSAQLVIDKRKIELEEPIHQVGSQEVTIRLGKDIAPKIKVTVKEKEAS